jgi:hypothetical protein
MSYDVRKRYLFLSCVLLFHQLLSNMYSVHILVKHVFSSYSWHNKVYDMLFLKGPSENQILNSYKWNSHIRGSNSYARLFTRISSTLLKFCLLFPFAFPKLVSTRFNFRRLDRSILRVSIFTNIQNSFSRPWDVFHPNLKISETKQ